MTDERPEAVRIAILDDGDRLVGYNMTTDPEPSDVVVAHGCDLPADGTYKYMQGEGCFMPLGHGFPRSAPQPVAESRVLYLMARIMDNPPEEVRLWLVWYEDNVARQHEEAFEANRKQRRQRGPVR